MIDIYEFFTLLSENLARGDVIVTDAGSTFNAGPEGIKLKEGTRYIVPGGLAPMGYALPASIGISLALSTRVLCLSGDGSFQLNIQELQSVVHYRLPIKIFLFNNNCYLTIRQTQERYFKRCIGESPASGLSFPQPRKIAEAYGIQYQKAAEAGQLRAALRETLSSPGPVLCEIKMSKEQKIIRPLEEL